MTFFWDVRKGMEVWVLRTEQVLRFTYGDEWRAG